MDNLEFVDVQLRNMLNLNAGRGDTLGLVILGGVPSRICHSADPRPLLGLLGAHVLLLQGFQESKSTV